MRAGLAVKVHEPSAAAKLTTARNEEYGFSIAAPIPVAAASMPKVTPKTISAQSCRCPVLFQDGCMGRSLVPIAPRAACLAYGSPAQIARLERRRAK